MDKALNELREIVSDMRSAWSMRPHGANAVADDVMVCVQKLYKLRRIRETVFGCDLFSDPAWDIMLDLYVADHEGRQISITSACIGSSAPATTALRWIDILCKKGHLKKYVDQRDRRRTYVALGSVTRIKMEEIFRSILG